VLAKPEIRISKSETNSNIQIQNHQVGAGVEVGEKNDLSKEDENNFGKSWNDRLWNHP
jgi:hypothetical protein